MKKILIAVNLILVTLIVSGCGCSKKEKVLECSSNRENYAISLYFKADSNNKITYFEKKEQISNYNPDLLENYKNNLIFLKNWDDSIDFYDYEYEINDDVISTDLKIDFSKVNHDDLLSAPGLYSKYYDYEKKYFDLNKAIEIYKSDSDYENLQCNKNGR